MKKMDKVVGASGLRFVDARSMSNGMRMPGDEPLTEKEIEIVRRAIRDIEADESVFVFNGKHSRTCYITEEDKIYIGRNIFPDNRYNTHPRDLMSIRAVLAHEYYGHRTHRDEYLRDLREDTITTPEWEDECRASIDAAKLAPGLSAVDRYQLVEDAVMRGVESGVYIEKDDFMMEVLYGYGKDERNIVPVLGRIRYVSIESQGGDAGERGCDGDVPKVSRATKCVDLGFER